MLCTFLGIAVCLVLVFSYVYDFYHVFVNCFLKFTICLVLTPYCYVGLYRHITCLLFSCIGLYGLFGLDYSAEKHLTLHRGPWTEESDISAAKSYHDFAKASNFWGYLRGDKYKDYPARIFTEDRAMDSLQQIMFSLTEFNNRYNNFPEEMTIISYELKRERFEKLHFKTAKELMLPSAQPRIDVSWQGTPTFIGIDPRELKQYTKFEKVKALMDLEAQISDIWKGSPFGLSRVLMDRKKKRNVRKIDITYKLVIAAGPELVAALEKNVKEAPIEEVVDLSVN